MTGPEFTSELMPLYGHVNSHAAQAQDNGAAGHQHSASNATAVDHLSCHSSSRTMMHLSKSCLERNWS